MHLYVKHTKSKSLKLQNFDTYFVANARERDITTIKGGNKIFSFSVLRHTATSAFIDNICINITLRTELLIFDMCVYSISAVIIH